MNIQEQLEQIIQEVAGIPEKLGNAEDIMIDTPAMDLLTESVDSVVLRLRAVLQSAQSEEGRVSRRKMRSMNWGMSN